VPKFINLDQQNCVLSDNDHFGFRKCNFFEVPARKNYLALVDAPVGTLSELLDIVQKEYPNLIEHKELRKKPFQGVCYESFTMHGRRIWILKTEVSSDRFFSFLGILEQCME